MNIIILDVYYWFLNVAISNDIVAKCNVTL